MTHKAKECTERPRKLGAKYTHKNIAQDEYDTTTQNIKLNFESKRDRWNGYNPDTYKRDVIEPWRNQEEIVEEVRAEKAREVKAQEKAVAAKVASGKDDHDDVYSSDSSDEEEARNAENSKDVDIEGTV